MYNLGEMVGNTQSLTAAGTTAGSTTGFVKTVNTLAYTINGVFKSLSATAASGLALNMVLKGVATAISVIAPYYPAPAGVPQQPWVGGPVQNVAPQQSSLFMFYLDASGNFYVAQGVIVNFGDDTYPPARPVIGPQGIAPLNFAQNQVTPFAMAKVTNSNALGGASFIPGTTPWSTSGGITVTFSDVSTEPAFAQ